MSPTHVSEQAPEAGALPADQQKLAYYIHPESDCAFADTDPLPNTDGLVEYIGPVGPAGPNREEFLRVAGLAHVHNAHLYSFRGPTCPPPKA